MFLDEALDLPADKRPIFLDRLELDASEARDVLARAYGEDHPDVAEVAQDLAELFEAWDRAADAAAWRARAEEGEAAPPR